MHELKKDEELDPETYSLLQDQDWEAIGKELTAFAIFRARNYRWRRGGDWELAAGQTIADVVQDVIVKTIEGKRRWDPSKGQLVPWLKDQMKSEIDHLCYSAAHIHEVPTPEEEDEEELTDRIEYSASQRGDLAIVHAQNPEEIMLKKEEIEERENAIFQAADGDPELEEILETVRGFEPKPRDLAADLGVPVQDIYNRLKRLRGRARQLLVGR